MKSVIFAVLLMVAVMESTSGLPAGPPPPYHPPYPPPPPSYPAPSYPVAPYHPETHYKEEGKPYAFSYEVNDDYAGTHFGQNENSDGKVVKGTYTVDLPDGRKQTVNYKADHYDGFQADVSYQGHATYPAPATYHHAKPAPYHPKPAPYRPKPAPYHPGPPVYHK